MSAVTTTDRTGGAAARGRQALPSNFVPVIDWLAAELGRDLGRAVTLSPAGYQERPFSHVLRVRLTGSSSALIPARHLYVKIFKSDGSPEDVARIRARVVQDHDRTAAIHSAMARWPDLRVVRPVACSPEFLTIVTEEARGETLLQHLEAQASWIPGGRAAAPVLPLDRVGAWLSAFQTTAAPEGRLSVDDLRTYMDIRLARLVELPAAAFDARDRARALRHIDRLGQAAAEEDVLKVPVHADLAPGNVLVSSDHVTVLDFAMVTTGSRLHDLTRLLVQIDLMSLKPQLRRATLDEAARAVVRGFDAGLDADRPMFRLLSLQHRLNHLNTLAKKKTPFPENAYNWRLRRHHRAWIARELERG